MITLDYNSSIILYSYKDIKCEQKQNDMIKWDSR